MSLPVSRELVALEVSRDLSLLAWMARSTAIWLNPILVRYRFGSRACAGIDATTISQSRSSP